MRELKFRAWDDLKNKWVENFCLTGGSVFSIRSSPEFQKLVDRWYKKKGVLLGGDYAEIDYTDWYAVNNIIVQQYTGLKDRNGKEIYEGDIVKWGDLPDSKEMEVRIAEVKFNPDLQLDCKNITYPFVFHWGNFAYGGKQLEIIGNIYDHQHLLNTEQNVQASVATGDAERKEP